jgi:hypothetical protein
MKDKLLIVAAALALSSPAFAQNAGGATTSAPVGTTPGTAPGAPPAAAPATTTGVVGITPPGVAGGVTPYRPAGAPAPGTTTGGISLTPPASGAVGGAALGSSTSFIASSINTTLQAGQIPGSDSATVGTASAGTGLRMPNPSTGAYNGAAGPTYGGPGATPYAGPGSLGLPQGAAPYTGPAGSAVQGH